MIIFNIPNPIQYLNLTTTLLTINKQQLGFIEEKVIVNGLLIARIEPYNKVTQFSFLTLQKHPYYYLHWH